MSKKFLTLTLTVLLLNLLCVAPVSARAAQDKEAKRSAKVKKVIAAIGTGTRAKVEVKLRDKTKLEGYVSEIGDEHFAVTDEKTNVATTVTYAQVEKVRPAPSLKDAVRDLGFTKTFRAIGIGVGVLTFAILAYCLTGRCEE